MLADDFAKAISGGWGIRQNRLVIQIPLHVSRHCIGRCVTAIAILIEGFHYDPVEFTSKLLAEFTRVRLAAIRNRGQYFCFECADSRTRARRIHFADHSPHFVKASVAERVAFERRVAGEEFVEQHTQ